MNILINTIRIAGFRGIKNLEVVEKIGFGSLVVVD
jgi:hypothetical protein